MSSLPEGIKITKAENNDNNNNNNNNNNSFSTVISNGVNTFIEFLTLMFGIIGLFGIKIAKVIAKGCKSFYNRYLKKYAIKLDGVFLSVRKKFSMLAKYFFYKTHMFFKFFVDAKNVIKAGFNSKPNSNIIVRILTGILFFFRGVRNNAGIFLTILNYALPVAAAFAFINIINYASNLNFAVSVEYNGEHIGYIEDEQIFESAQSKLQERMIYTDGDETVDNIPKFTLAIVDDGNLKNVSEVTDAIIRSSTGEIIKAVGLSIDGEFYGAVKDGRQLSSTLNEMLTKYKTGSENETVSFAKDVKTEEGIFRTKNIVNENELIEKLTELEEKEVYYEISSGDTPIIIASKNDMSLDELTALNPTILKSCVVGRQVLVNKAEAFLPVKVTRSETYDVPVAFTTTYSKSSSLYKGQSKTSRAGVNGTRRVTADVEYVDGVEVGRSETSSYVVSDPIEAIVEQGTMALPTAPTLSANVSRSDAGFIWPVSGGYISQRYGRYHNGIDYAYRGNGYKQPIVSVLPGTVTFAGWSGTYGYLVILQSPGGITTYYAHCSSLLVSAGETVSQGQLIARVGSTGRSTGNHLHFRVLVNGVERNPLNYLP